MLSAYVRVLVGASVTAYAKGRLGSGYAKQTQSIAMHGTKVSGPDRLAIRAQSGWKVLDVAKKSSLFICVKCGTSCILMLTSSRFSLATLPLGTLKKLAFFIASGLLGYQSLAADARIISSR